MTEPIISINDLSVYFNKKKALNNVTMDFYPNEITALIGPSGSGKSTPAPFYQPNGRFKIPNGHLLVLFHTTVTMSTVLEQIPLNSVKKSEWSSNNPILFQCQSMKTWFMAFVSMVSKIRLFLIKQ